MVSPVRMRLLAVPLLVAIALCSCGNDDEPSTAADLPDSSESPQDEANESTCEELAFVRDNWNIDSPRPGWPADVVAAAQSAEAGLTEEQAEQLRTATGTLASITDPEAEVDFMAEGAAQQEVNTFSQELCGFEVFL
jgi:hypothetical protein